MKKQFFSLLLLVIIFVPGLIKAAKVENPRIEMAILLDTSGSMEGLIEQAKSQLWKIVNELALTKRNSKTPELYVALYEYGKDSIPSEQGYIRMISPLTGDLDKISEELFILQTNGGDEYCGEVISKAVDQLKWSNNTNDLKLIFIAGNEPFTQGYVDYQESCSRAIAQGIIVNTIFCGDFQEGINTSWKDGADLADGTYMNIDQNMQVVEIPTPQDEELIQLGQQLNETYVAYGYLGEEAKERQVTQDANAMSLSGGTMAERTIAKSSVQYRNESWDLVDAQTEGTIELDELEEEQLPEVMKGMTPEERKEYVEKMAKKRQEIQQKISLLSEERKAFIAQEKKKIDENTLDTAIIQAVRQQAENKNYIFEK